MENNSLVLVSAVEISMEAKSFCSAVKFAATVGGSGNKSRRAAHQLAIRLLASGLTPEATIIRGVELREEGIEFLGRVDKSHAVVYTV